MIKRSSMALILTVILLIGLFGHTTLFKLYLSYTKELELPPDWRLQYNGSGKWKVKQPDYITCFCDKKSREAMVFNTKEEAIKGAYKCIKLSKK